MVKLTEKATLRLCRIKVRESNAPPGPGPPGRQKGLTIHLRTPQPQSGPLHPIWRFAEIPTQQIKAAPTPTINLPACGWHTLT